MNDRCEKYRHLIASAVANDLSSDGRGALETHLAECPECMSERDQLAATMEALRSLGDERPPRHFFIGSETKRQRSSRAFSSLSPVWRGAWAATLVALAVAVSLLIAGLHVRVEHGVLMVSVGQSPEERWLEPYRSEIVAEALDRSRELDRDWVEQVRHEVAGSLAAYERRGRQVLDSGLHDLENRVGQSLTSSSIALQTEFSQALFEIHDRMDLGRRQDFGLVQDHLQRFAAYDQQQDERTEAIFAAVVKMTGTR